MNTYVNNIYYYALRSKCRIIICYGGRDSGKSFFVGGQMIPLRMEQDKYFRGVTIRRTYTSLKESCFLEINDGIEALKAKRRFKPSKVSPIEITHKNGNVMYFRGMDDQKKIKSMKGISFIWVEEGEDLTYLEFIDLVMLLRAGEVQTIIITFNPIDEDHFVNKEYVLTPPDKVFMTFDDGDKKVWTKTKVVEVGKDKIPIKALIIRSTYDDNKFVPPIRKAMIESLKDTDPFLYEVYRKGGFGQKGGKILYNVEEVDFKAKGWEFKNFDKRGYSQDFGFNHANAILSLAEKDDCLYVFSELFGHEQTTDEWIKKANALGYDKSLRMVCDSASPGPIKTWRDDARYNAVGVKKYQGSVKDQIDKLKRYKKIYINSICINTLKEAKGWKWRQNKHGVFTDEPVAIYDDTMAALRYGTDLFYIDGAKMIKIGR